MKNNSLSIGNILKLWLPEFLSVGSVIFLPLFLDFYFISCLNSSGAIATFGIVGNIWQLIFKVPESIGIATLILVGKENGKKNWLGVKEVLCSLLGLCFLWGLIQFCVISIFSKNIVKFAGISGLLLNSGEKLLRLHSASGLFACVFFVFAGYFRGLKNTFYPGVISFLSTAMFLLLDYVFVFGRLGMPKLEVFASPVASMIKYAFSGLILLILFFCKYRTNFFDLIGCVKSEKVINGIKISGPIILDKLIMSSTYIFLYKIASSSSSLIPIIEILKNVMLLFFAPCVAMSLVATILVSNFSGAGLGGLAFRSVKIIFLIILAWCFISSVFVFCFSDFLVTIFCHSGLLKNSAFLLKIAFPLVFFDAMQSLAASACRGLGLVWHIFAIRILSVLVFFYPAVFIIQNFCVTGFAHKAFLCFVSLYLTFGIIALLLFFTFYKNIKSNSRS